MKDRKVFALMTLAERVKDISTRAIVAIEDHTTTGVLSDNTGCPMTNQEKAAPLIEILAITEYAVGILCKEWERLTGTEGEPK